MTPCCIFVNPHYDGSAQDILKQNHPGGLRKPEPAGVTAFVLMKRIKEKTALFDPVSIYSFLILTTMKPLPARLMNS